MGSAEELKAEGNALYAKNDFAAAIIKYTKAIALESDDKRLNAILYANRSACQRGLKSYTESLSDAVKATEIDPSYTKAWGRAAEGYSIIKDYINSVRAYKTAIATFPASNLTSADQKQKTQYEQAMARNQAIVDRPPRDLFEVNPEAYQIGKNEKLSWTVAEQMIPELTRKQNQDSSAWALTAAMNEFKAGVSLINELREVNGGVVTRTGALIPLVEAIITDHRIVHIDDSGWHEKLDRQMMAEKEHWKPWPLSASPTRVIEEAPKRVQKEGWAPVRKSLNMTIRFWILKGFLGSIVSGEYEQKFENLQKAVTVLMWGAKTWKDVPKDDRGAIFEPTFINATRKLYLIAILEYCADEERGDEMLELLAKESNALLADAKSSMKNVPAGLHINAMWSYYRYPIGTANASLGFYHVQKASRASEALERTMHLRLAAQFYLQASSDFATDDELHTWYQHCVLEYLRAIHGPADAQLSIVLHLKEALPRMMKIWSSNAIVRRGMESKKRAYDADLLLEQGLRAKINSGSG